MKRVFTAWGESKPPFVGCLIEGEGPPRGINGDLLLPEGHVLLWRIEVGSVEEAMAISNLRNGWTYEPEGEAAHCPDCGAVHYPDGSGQCWKCDHQC